MKTIKLITLSLAFLSFSNLSFAQNIPDKAAGTAFRNKIIAFAKPILNASDIEVLSYRDFASTAQFWKTSNVVLPECYNDAIVKLGFTDGNGAKQEILYHLFFLNETPCLLEEFYGFSRKVDPREPHADATLYGYLRSKGCKCN